MQGKKFKMCRNTVNAEMQKEKKNAKGNGKKK